MPGRVPTKRPLKDGARGKNLRNCARYLDVGWRKNPVSDLVTDAIEPILDPCIALTNAVGFNGTSRSNTNTSAAFVAAMATPRCPTGALDIGSHLKSGPPQVST